MKFSQNSLLITIVFLRSFKTIIGVPTKLTASKGLCSNEQNCVNAQQMQTIESYMDTSADPCENFYEYACGNWKQTTNYTSAYVQQDENFNQILVDIFEKLQLKQDEEVSHAAYEKANYYYKSCQELNTFELEKFLPLKTTEPFVWWKLLSQLQSYDFQEVLLSIKLVQEEDEHKKFYIFLSEHSQQQKLNLTENVLKSLANYAGLDRKLLRTKLESFEEKLYKILEEIAEETAAEGEAASATTPQSLDKSKNSIASREINIQENNEVKNVQITEKIKNLSVSNQQQQESNNSMPNNAATEKPVTIDESYLTLKDLQLQLPDNDWVAYFDLLLDNTIKLTNDSIFVISNVKGLQKLIDFFNVSIAEDLSLYLLTHFLMQLEAQLPQVNTAKSCIQLLRNFMPLVINQLYEDYHYGSIRAKSDAVINNIFHQLKAKLNVLFKESAINLNKTQLEYVQHKNQQIQINIGNMPANRSVDFVNDFYALVNITRHTNFYQNHLELVRNKLQTQYRILKAYQVNTTNVYESFDASTGWGAATTPYYIFARNTIIIPFAYLQLPFYHHKLVDIFQYSKLGWVLAHETMHGFDTDGLWYDADSCFGNFAESIMNKQEFRNSIACLKLQPTASIGERIADISGLHLLMSAYSNDMQTLTLAERKLFFINLAQYFCDKNTTIELNLKKLSHDQSKARVLYMLSNTPEFGQTFNCSTKSEQLCRLW